MTNACLTDLLAVRVMGWTVGPARFMMGNRGWMSRWRFQPTEKIEDALRLLQEAAPQDYSICGDGKGDLQVRVRVGACTGTATGGPMAMAITIAVARAMGLDVPDEPRPVIVTDGRRGQAPRRRPRGN